MLFMSHLYLNCSKQWKGTCFMSINMNQQSYFIIYCINHACFLQLHAISLQLVCCICLRKTYWNLVSLLNKNTTTYSYWNLSSLLNKNTNTFSCVGPNKLYCDNSVCYWTRIVHYKMSGHSISESFCLAFSSSTY